MSGIIFTSSDYSPEIKSFQEDAFLSGKKNDGYRFFTKENINIDFKNRILTITEDSEQKTLGAQNYQERGQIDGEFLTNPIFQQLKEGFDFENKIFDGEINTKNTEKAQNYKPKIGGKIAFTNNKIFLNTNGEPYIRMPLANPSINYSFKGKSAGSSVQVGDTKMKIDKIIKQIQNQDSSSLKILQFKNPKEKILTKSILEPQNELGNWTVKIYNSNGKSFTQLKNCYISRAYDGAFEIMKTDIYKSYEKLEENLDVNENVGYDRVSTIIKLSNLTKFIKGDIEVKKVFYKNELRDIENLPEEFTSKIYKNQEGKILIKNFEMTPPLAMFLKQVQMNPFNPVLKPVINKEIKKHKNYILGTLKTKSGLEKEKEFGEKFNLTKFIEREEKLNFNDFEKIINNSNFSENEKKELKTYIGELKNKNRNSIILNPDFEIKLPSGKIILIEYKNSKKANTNNKNQKLNIKLFMLFGDSKNIESYNTIIGNNYGVDYQDIGHGIKTYSEKFLDEEGVKNKTAFTRFFKVITNPGV